MPRDNGFNSDDYASEPLTVEELTRADNSREYPDYESAYDHLSDMVPDTPPGVMELVDDWLAEQDLTYEDIMDLMWEWEDLSEFWDWFRDEFYGEG